MTDHSVAVWWPSHPLLGFVGQSVGPREYERQRPFIGPAGQEIRSWLRVVGLDPDEDIFWTNVTMEFHPGEPNYVPPAKEIKAAIPELEAQMKQVGVRGVVLVGGPASHLAFKGTMRAMQGSRGLFAGLPTWACYHPSAALRAQTLQEYNRIQGMALEVLREAASVAHGEDMPEVVLPEPVYVKGVEIL